MTNELRDYMGEVESLPALNFSQYGYTCYLDEHPDGIKIELYYKNGPAGARLVRRVSATHGVRNFNTILSEIMMSARALYDQHNQSLRNPDILKAIEDRINGTAEMLVLTSSPHRHED